MKLIRNTGAEGFEPPATVLETAMLPDYTMLLWGK